MMVKTIVYYSINNNGDGSAGITWWPTADDASREQQMASEGFSEDCSGSVETFVGSDIHLEALNNAEEHRAKMKAKALGRTDWDSNHQDLL